MNIIEKIYNNIVDKYIKTHHIEEVIIDSTDIINANCNKQYLHRSYKLSKQAARLSIICDKNKIPLIYHLDAACHPDQILGFELAKDLKIPDNKKHFLVGDKGYIMGSNKTKELLKNNKLKLVIPKRTYRKRVHGKNYKSKKRRIRHSKQMKDILTKRIIIEHTNSILHRSFKRLDKIYDKSFSTFEPFIQLAIICIILHNKK